VALIACAAMGYIAALSTIPQDSQLTEQISILQGNLDAKEAEINNIQSQLQEYENLITALNQELLILREQSGDENIIPETSSDQIETVEKIAYGSFTGSTTYVHVINSDGTNEIRLAEGINPKWSPDGKKIAFITQGGALYIMNDDGIEKNIVIENIIDAPWGTFSWSPDQRIFLIKRGGDIYTVNVDGSNLLRLTETGDCGSPTFSPDGRKIAYVSGRGSQGEFSNVNCSIITMNFDGTGKTTITTIEPPGYTRRGVEYIMWSPQGDKIVYGFDEQICIINTDGTDKMELVEGYLPIWSPDGGKIAYLGGDGDILIMNPDGTDITKLVDNEVYESTPQYYSWSPDGNHIAFSYFKIDISIVNIDGSGITQLVELAYDCRGIHWSPS